MCFRIIGRLCRSRYLERITKMKLTYPTYLSKKEQFVWENPTPFEREVHFEAVDLAAGESTKGSRVSGTKRRNILLMVSFHIKQVNYSNYRSSSPNRGWKWKTVWFRILVSPGINLALQQIPEIPILPTFAPAKSTCRCAYCRLIGGCSRSRTGATCNRVLASGARPQVWIVASKHTVSVRQNQGFLECPHVVYARDQSGAHWWNIKEQIEDYQFVNSRSQERSRDHLVDTQTFSMRESSAFFLQILHQLANGFFMSSETDSPYMDVSKNRGTPKWRVYNGKPY